VGCVNVYVIPAPPCANSFLGANFAHSLKNLLSPSSAIFCYFPNNLHKRRGTDEQTWEKLKQTSFCNFGFNYLPKFYIGVLDTHPGR
jgi:hypothetical protein